MKNSLQSVADHNLRQYLIINNTLRPTEGCLWQKCSIAHLQIRHCGVENAFLPTKTSVWGLKVSEKCTKVREKADYLNGILYFCSEI